MITLAALCFFIQTPAHAGVYKWTDENGQVHYGEQPGNTSAETVIIRQNETTTPRTIKKSEEGKDESPDGEEGKDGKEEKDGKEWTEWEEVPISKQEKRKLCQEGKSDYAAISGRGRMREINKKGEYVFLTEQQRQQRLADAKKKQRDYCH